jgi:hypothetical protein
VKAANNAAKTDEKKVKRKSMLNTSYSSEEILLQAASSLQGLEGRCWYNKAEKASSHYSLAANISVKLVPTTFINTYWVSQIPICKMESQILALKKTI